MKHLNSKVWLFVALLAVSLGWCVDRLAFRDSFITPTHSVDTADKFADVGIKLGRALESTTIYPMHDNNGQPKDPERWSQIRKRQLLLNVVNMADVDRIKKQLKADPSHLSDSEVWNTSHVILGARSLELLNVHSVQEFQEIFEERFAPTQAPEFFASYVSEDGSLKADFVNFIKSALSWNAERATQSTE